MLLSALLHSKLGSLLKGGILKSLSEVIESYVLLFGPYLQSLKLEDGNITAIIVRPISTLNPEVAGPSNTLEKSSENPARLLSFECPACYYKGQDIDHICVASS